MTKKSQRLGHTNPGQHAWDDFYTELQPHKINKKYRKEIPLAHYIAAILITIFLTIITPPKCAKGAPAFMCGDELAL